ncbi:MAG: hypothetical protein WCY32_05900 [Burkholderiaceae bacterium]
MKELLFALYLFAGIAILAWGFLRSRRMLQFPFLAASVFMGWMFPQLLGLSGYDNWPRGALEKTTAMAALCMIGCWAGYTLNRRRSKLFDWDLDRRRLLLASAVLSGSGMVFHYMVNQMAPEVIAQHGGQWTGIITIYAFFSRLLAVGFCIALVLHLDRSSRATLVLLFLGFIIYLHRILILGRRAATVELVLMVLLALWFQRRWIPPRGLMATVLIVGTLLVNSAGDYRNTMLGDDRHSWSGAGLEAILDIDYLGNLKRISEGRQGNHELSNALYEIEAADRTLQFDYGLSLWNGFVQQFVPGQMVGVEIKAALQLDRQGNAESVFGHVAHTGTTLTGITDAFQSFWFFGAIKFMLIGFIMSRWWRAAEAGNRAAQIILMLCVTASLHAITHSTNRFFMAFFELAVFVVPAFLYARISRQPSSLEPMRV